MPPFTHDPATLADAEKLTECFEVIYKERMKDIPIINTELDVEAVEFQIFEGRTIGMMVTPWFINLIMLPKEGDTWDQGKPGDKDIYHFPGKDCEMMINEVDGYGFCKTFSLFSPVKDFNNQEAARVAAAIFLRDLLDETKRVEKTFSEEQIERYLDKEDMCHKEEFRKSMEDLKLPEDTGIKEEVNRRDLLRGSLRKSSDDNT